MRIAVFDYGAGNLHSLCKALALTGAQVRVESEALKCLATDLLVLPGVGAFGKAAAALGSARASVRDALRDGHPALGICLGMQLLFDESDEAEGAGIGLLAGRVRRLEARRVPHIGWNTVVGPGEPLLDHSRLDYAYYANSYVCDPVDDVATAWTTHESRRFPAIVRAARTIGVQFHPEKSGDRGVAFLNEAARAALCESCS